MVLSSMKRVLGGSHVEYYVVPQSRVSHDLNLSLVDLYHAFQHLLTTSFKKVGPAKGIKFQSHCNALLEKFVFDAFVKGGSGWVMKELFVSQ